MEDVSNIVWFLFALSFISLMLARWERRQIRNDLQELTERVDKLDGSPR